MKKNIYTGLLVLFLTLFFGVFIYYACSKDQQGVEGERRLESSTKKDLKDEYNNMSGGLGTKPVVIKKSDLEKDYTGQDNE